MHTARERPLLAATRESSHAAAMTQCRQNRKKKLLLKKQKKTKPTKYSPISTPGSRMAWHITQLRLLLPGCVLHPHLIPRYLAAPKGCRGLPRGPSCLPVQETQEPWVPSLGQEDPWRREWQCPPVFFPGKCHGQRTLADYSPWSRKESVMTEET